MSHHELKRNVVVKTHISFGECSASDSRLVLQLGNALNKRVGRLQGHSCGGKQKHLPETECQMVILNHYFTDRVILAYSQYYRKYA
jgi:hypothetical protein